MVAEARAETSDGDMGRAESATKLPLLRDIRIASPCSESWEGMVGDDRSRFCGGCMKNVYNLSAMTGEEAQALIAEKEGNVCVRLFRRRDGTVLTADCDVGVRRKRVTKIAAAALAFGGAGLALAAAGGFGAPPEDVPSASEDTRPSPKVTKPKTRTTGATFWEELFTPDEPEAKPEMGDISAPQPLMGEIAPLTPEDPARAPGTGEDKVPVLGE